MVFPVYFSSLQLEYPDWNKIRKHSFLLWKLYSLAKNKLMRNHGSIVKEKILDVIECVWIGAIRENPKVLLLENIIAFQDDVYCVLDLCFQHLGEWCNTMFCAKKRIIMTCHSASVSFILTLIPITCVE